MHIQAFFALTMDELKQLGMEPMVIQKKLFMAIHSPLHLPSSNPQVLQQQTPTKMDTRILTVLNRLGARADGSQGFFGWHRSYNLLHDLMTDFK